MNHLSDMQRLSVLTFVLFVSQKSSAIFDNEINLECVGKRMENVTLTAYYPDYDDVDHEQGYLDKNGHRLRTLQDFIDDRNQFVTLSMDPELNLPYGTPVCIPELNIHFGHRIRIEVRDSSYDLKGGGFRKAEICVRSETDSYDITVNRYVTLYFEKYLK